MFLQIKLLDMGGGGYSLVKIEKTRITILDFCKRLVVAVEAVTP